MSVTPRERVMLAASHQEPDRVPLALWGSWYGVTDALYFQVLDKLGWQPVPPFRPELAHSVNYYDDRLLAELDVDVRHVDPGVANATSRLDPDGFDGWGLQWRHAGLYRSAVYHPLEKASVQEIAEFPLPGPETIQEQAVRDRLHAIGTLDQEYAVAGRAVASYGFFEMAQALRKNDQLLMDMVLEPEVVYTLVDRLFACYAALHQRFLDIAGPRLDLIELPGDDFAGNSAPIISLDMFDRFFSQPYRQLIHLIKDHSPHIKVIFHSDGAVTPFLSRLVDLGVDVFHPLEPLPATDLAAVKTEFGDRLAFLGGIDIRETMQGREAGVVAEVKARMRQLAAGGGYILAPANHLQGDVPPGNLFALYRTAARAGRYPLRLDDRSTE